MSETRMPRGDYKKMLFRVPADVLDYLEDRSAREVRSINAEWVYLLRQLMHQEHDERYATRPSLPLRSKATSASH